MRRPTALFVIAITLALVSTACGGSTSDEIVASDQEEVDAASAPGQPADSEDSDDGADGDDGSSSDEPQTLEELLGNQARFLTGGGGRGPGAIDPDDIAEQQRQVQELTRECMLNQGFDYTMEESGGGLGGLFGAVLSQGADLSPEDFAAEYGFGISTRFDALLEGGAAAFGIGADEVDVNQELLDAMSTSEADAWEMALNGEPPERDAEGRPIDPETGEVIAGGQGRRGFQRGGCAGDAQTAVRGDVTALQELADEYEELEARIEADPRLVELGQEWTSCMNDAGYFYDNVEEVRAEIQGEFRPLIAGVFGFGPGRGQEDSDDASSTGLSQEQEDQLADLQQRERDLAIANNECSADLGEEADEIRARYESEFIDANRDALESIAG